MVELDRSRLTQGTDQMKLDPYAYAAAARERNKRCCDCEASRAIEQLELTIKVQQITERYVPLAPLFPLKRQKNIYPLRRSK